MAFTVKHTKHIAKPGDKIGVKGKASVKTPKSEPPAKKGDKESEAVGVGKKPGKV